jgi:hypothetical protein
MPNVNLAQAKSAKFDEFYTLWDDVEKEIMAYLDFDPDVFRGKVEGKRDKNVSPLYGLKTDFKICSHKDTKARSSKINVMINI